MQCGLHASLKNKITDWVAWGPHFQVVTISCDLDADPSLKMASGIPSQVEIRLCEDTKGFLN